MPDYERVDIGGMRWFVSTDCLDLFRGGPFADLDAALRSARVVKDLGIKTTYVVASGSRGFFVKRYKPGSWGNRLRRLFFGPRARRELEACRTFLSRKVP